jgi:RHS repeat-associated protein
MNPAEFGSLPSDACTLDTAGSYGPDRIGLTGYDAAGRPNVFATAYGTADEAWSWVAYSGNGQVWLLSDGNGHLTAFQNDGFDRRTVTYYPLADGSNVNWADYEADTLDAAGNVTNRRLRDNSNIGFSYDHLNRLTEKDPPGSEPTITYGYDLMGRLLSAATSGHSLSFTWDALGRNLTQTGPLGTASYAYDDAGRRTRLTYPGSGLYVDYDYLVTGEISAIRENGATSGVGVLGTYAYDDRGRRTLLTRGNGTTAAYTYDDVSRLTQLVENLSGTSYDQTLGFSYGPASQIAATTRSNDAYAWTNHYAVNRSYTANGLNQYTASGSVTPTYDARGNVETAGGSTYYVYNSENMLTSSWGQATLSYDPLQRLFQVSGASTTRMLYDGESLIAEYDGSNGLQRRYVHGPGIDEPLVWYQGTGTSDRRFYHADERGSIVATSDGSGAMLSVNAYDEYGIPGASNAGRFQYTGQQWLSEIGMYHYRARIYSPTLGRFLQTDPIGFDGGLNIYAYVRNDPVNFGDPSGLVPQTCSRALAVSTWLPDIPESPNGGSVFFEWNTICWDSTDTGDRGSPFDSLGLGSILRSIREKICSLVPHPTGVRMLSVSRSFSIPIPGLTGSFGVGIAVDPRSNVSIPAFGFVGAGRGGGASFTINNTTSNAQNFMQFNGLFAESSSMGGIGVGGGVAGFVGPGGVHGTTTSVGLVTGYSVSAGASYTDVGPSLNLYSALGCSHG